MNRDEMDLRKERIETAMIDAADYNALRKENDILRGIAAKLMPCHYCGVDNIGKCPHGFPGCALADDLMEADACASRECWKLREDNRLLREQIRVGDAAFNRQHEELAAHKQALEKAREALDNYVHGPYNASEIVKNKWYRSGYEALLAINAIEKGGK